MSKFYFVVGGDILSTIGTWGNAKQLLENVHFIVVPRKGYSLSSQIVPKKYYFCSYFPGPGDESFTFPFILSTNNLFILSLETPNENELLICLGEKYCV